MKNRFLSVGAVALLVLFPCAADAAEAVVREFAAADRINWSAKCVGTRPLKMICGGWQVGLDFGRIAAVTERMVADYD